MHGCASNDFKQSDDTTATEEDENVLEDEDAAEGNMDNGEPGDAAENEKDEMVEEDDAKDDLYTSAPQAGL